REAIASILLFGGVMAAGTLVMFSQYQAADLVRAQTVGFTTLVIFQLFAVVSSRSAFMFNKMNLLSNPKLAVAVLASLLIQVAVVHWPPFQTVFGTVALSAMEWAAILTAGMIGFLVMEAGKKLLVRKEFASAA
ncbi:MAG: cation-translocating P-type ATPase C-terminal domain-containing protein, partial [Candidatus Micrarchaeota archaeon]|nr:cation-translocating P-type ATPase C-terminal domain-containing protein [Candidatus Micrarchaeota archaeon]